MGSAVPWFPIVGLVLGGLLGLAHLGLSEVLSPVPAALLTIGLGAVATGAFHEDGLADTADAFGGFTPARRLEIMRDSRIGTFGTIALVVAVALKVAALARLEGLDGLIALVLAHSLGRAAAIAVMAAGPEARTEGLAAGAADLPRGSVVAVVSIAAVVATALGPPSAVSAGVLAVVGVLSVRIARVRFGGTTGDVLGAVEQVGEIVVLTAAAELVAEQGWLWT